MVRQPIFDLNMKVYAYELLFRSGLESVFQNITHDQATTSVISDSFYLTGINGISSGKPVSIRFTRNVLIGNYAQILPKEKLIVEILDDMSIDKEALEAVHRLKKDRYVIALKDFDNKALQSPLIDLVDFVKISFKKASQIKQSFFVRSLGGLNIKLVAEQIETYEEYHRAKEMGYTLFQGDFFCQPSIINTTRIPESLMTKIQLIQLANQPDPDFNKVSELIKHDIALSYKLLRYANSAYLGLQNPVTNIRHALMFLGQKNLRKWVSLMVLVSAGENKPSALITTAIVRARFCELLAELLGMHTRGDDLFLLGMFSTIDALLDKPMEEVLKDIPLAPDLKASLLGKTGLLREILDLVLRYESGDWQGFEALCKKHEINQDLIPKMHLEAVEMAEEFINSEEKERAVQT